MFVRKSAGKDQTLKEKTCLMFVRKSAGKEQTLKEKTCLMFVRPCFAAQCLALHAVIVLFV